MDEVAKTGDRVKVVFSSGRTISGKVVHIPEHVGDYWIIQTYFEGRKDTLEYIQNFESISFKSRLAREVERR